MTQKFLFVLLLFVLFEKGQCSVARDFFASYENMHDYLLETHDCQKIVASILFPAEDLFVKTALVTFPRSGNGWLRTMIERSFGFLTSSKYSESHQRESLPNNFLLKTHDPLMCKECNVQTEETLFSQAIRIVRNPFDSFSSYLFFLHVANFGRNATFDQEAKKAALLKQLDKLCQQLLEFDRFWTTFSSPTLVFRYEDLTHPQYMRQALQRIREFLIISPLNGRKRLHGIQKFLEITDFRINCTIQADTSRSITHYGSDIEFRKQILYSLSNYSSEQITKILTLLSGYLCKYQYQGLLAQSGLILSCPPTLTAHFG